MQLKIRAWDEKYKKYYRHLHQFITSYIAIVVNEDDELCLITGDGQYLQPLLFTGIKDKNGCEVYEGDILRNYGDTWICEKCSHEQLKYPDHGLYLVIYDTKRAEFSCDEINGENFMDAMVWHYNMEVIGNQFENPELLEQKECK